MNDNRELTGEERQLFEIIISELESKDQNVRDAAIVRLEQMDATVLGAAAGLLVEKLLWKCWTGPELRIVGNRTVLGILVKMGKPAVEHLRKLTENRGQYRLVQRACYALAKMGVSAYAPGARAKLATYIEGPDEYQGRDAIDAMVAIGDEYVVDYLRLVAIKKNPNQYLRSRSAYALGQIGDVRAIPDLIEALQDPSWSNVVPAAKWALNKLYAKKDKLSQS